MEKIGGNFEGKSILSLDQFDRESIDLVFQHAGCMGEMVQKCMPSEILTGNIVSCLILEPSTRTHFSFLSAVKRLGGGTISVTDIDPPKVSSCDFEKMVLDAAACSDIIVIRHSEIGSAARTAEISQGIPVINAGDGAGEHPTQTLLDLSTIHNRFKRLDELTGVICGDLTYGRTVHSLISGLSVYKRNKLYLLSPDKLKLAREDILSYKDRGIDLIEIKGEDQIPKDAHFWYWVRLQKERFSDKSEYAEVNRDFVSRFAVTRNMLKRHGNKDMILMCPLPRVGVILPEVDDDPRSVYFGQQIQNGVYVRMALMTLVLGKERGLV